VQVERGWGKGRVRRSLAVALINNGVCFLAVIVAAAAERADLGALVTAGIAAPLLVVALFHAFADIVASDRPPHALVQAWLALFLSLIPALLLVVFLLATNPQAHLGIGQLISVSR
jgi:amino acid transporter